MSDDTDRRFYPKVCPAEECTSTKFQKGPNGGNSFNLRCEVGHIIWVDPFFGAEHHGGFQARDTIGVYGEPR